MPRAWSCRSPRALRPSTTSPRRIRTRCSARRAPGGPRSGSCRSWAGRAARSSPSGRRRSTRAPPATERRGARVDGPPRLARVTQPLVCVFDYGFGNVRSAMRALEHVGARVELTRDRAIAESAAGLVVPGVGAFEAVMRGLVEARGDQIIGRRLAGSRPVLGICVGMQVMFERGVEHGIESRGLSQWPGTVELLQTDVVPNMGWAHVETPAGTALFKGIENERFYFVHS